jgi:CheY-like chemotaxis protein
MVMTSVSVMERETDHTRLPAAKRTFVLLAERDDALREVTARALEATGHFHVVEVPNVGEALEQLAKVPFAAVLLDPRVDGMQDLAATQRLYLMADRVGCPVIAFSDIPLGDLGLAYPFGFAGVVTKPYWALGLADEVCDICSGFDAGLGGRRRSDES